MCGDRFYGVHPPWGPKPLWYILSFLIPLLGLILGIVYLSYGASEKEPTVKAFGKNCLILAITSVLLCGICYVVFFVCNVNNY